VNRTAAEIARGDLDVCLIAGAEAMYTRLRARSAGAHLDWTPLADATAPPARLLGEEKRGNNDAEGAVGLLAPPVVYPLFENALRAANGESIDEHQRTIAGLWSRFSEVAGVRRTDAPGHLGGRIGVAPRQHPDGAHAVRPLEQAGRCLRVVLCQPQRFGHHVGRFDRVVERRGPPAQLSGADDDWGAGVDRGGHRCERNASPESPSCR
jgi:hypothetical protein